jgi:hypothetical protein
MYENYPATVTIRSDLGWYGIFHPLRVFIDGQLVASLHGNRTKDFPLPPGDHCIAVSHMSIKAKPVRIALQPEGRVELICASNQEPLHPWHVHGCFVLMVFSGIQFMLILFFPQALNAFQNAVVGELVVALVIGWIGMTLFFIRGFRKGAWKPTLSLTPVPADEEPLA